MKKILAILLVAAMVLSVSACGGTSGCQSHSDNDGDGKCDSCGVQVDGEPVDCTKHTDGDGDNRCDNCDAVMGGEDETYPRLTDFDGTPYKARAALQNCHVVYTYDADCEGDPATVLTGEFITCLHRMYCRTFTLYGYDEHIDGSAEYAQPDNHMACVFEDGVWTIYDFSRKIITSVDEPSYYSWEWDDVFNVTSFSDNTLRHWECYSMDFEPDQYSSVTEKLERIDGKSICGISCDGWIRYDNVTAAGYSIDSYDYRLWVDPVTQLTLRYEWYSGDYTLDDVSRVFEVTSLELNCVSQAGFDQMIAELVEDMGGESEFRHMEWGEYWDMFL